MALRERLVLKPKKLGTSTMTEKAEDPTLDKLQKEVKSLNDALQDQLETELDLSNQIVDHRVLLNESLETLEDMSSNYAVQLADNRVLENELSSLQEAVQLNVPASADGDSRPNQQQYPADKTPADQNTPSKEKVLQLEVRNLKEELAIEKRFRNIENIGTCHKIEALININEYLKSKLQEYKKKQSEKKAEFKNKETQTDCAKTNSIEQLENIRKTTVEIKKHYDEMLKDNKMLAHELGEEKNERCEAMQEMMKENHIIGRRNTELLREIEQLKLEKFEAVDIDLTEELRFTKMEFGKDIKAVMNKMHELLIENKILRARLRGSDSGTHRVTELLQLKTEMFSELQHMKKVYDKDHEKLKTEYDAVILEKQDSVDRLAEQRAQLMEKDNAIREIKAELEENKAKSLQWEKATQKYHKYLAKATNSNAKFQREITRLNCKMRNLDNYICQLHAAQTKHGNLENELQKFQDKGVAANLVLHGNETDKNKQSAKIQSLQKEAKQKPRETYLLSRDFESLKTKYTRSLENNNSLTEKLDQEKMQSDKLREFIVKQNKKLDCVKEQKEKLQMQIAAMELCTKNYQNTNSSLSPNEKDQEWCTPPRCYQAGDNKPRWAPL